MRVRVGLGQKFNKSIKLKAESWWGHIGFYMFRSCLDKWLRTASKDLLDQACCVFLVPGDLWKDSGPNPEAHGDVGLGLDDPLQSGIRLSSPISNHCDMWGLLQVSKRLV